MPQVYADRDENDMHDEEEEDQFDCYYSYLFERENNRSNREEVNEQQRPSLSSSTATDSSNEENGIWKTLGDAKKKQQDIRSRLKQNNSSKNSERQEQAPRPEHDNDGDEENRPDSGRDLRPEDVVRMIVRKASVAAMSLPPNKSVAPRQPPSSSSHSGSSSQSHTPPRPEYSSGESDSDSFEDNPGRSATSNSRSSDELNSSLIKGSIPIQVEAAPEQAPPSKWKKSTAHVHTTNFAGIVTPVKISRRRSDRRDVSESSDVTGVTKYFDAVEGIDDILDMDEDEYREHRQKQEEKPAPKLKDDIMSPGSSKGRVSDMNEFPLVKPLPFIPPTFKKPEEESESEYDPEYEFQRLYVENDDDDASFDQDYYNETYGEYNDDRDPEERERERRQKEWEALKRGEAVPDDEESVEEEEEEEPGLIGGLFSGVLSVGMTLGTSLFGGGAKDDAEEENDDAQEGSGHKRKPEVASPKSESMFSSSGFGFMTKMAKNPPKVGAPPPSRELEIIKKCQQELKLREKEAVDREAKQKELDKENLRMRKEEERERAKVEREVDRYRHEMIEMGKGDKLAKEGKKAKDEYEDRLAMEETLKTQQQKAEEMQERLQKVDTGKTPDKKKGDDDGSDSETSSEYEAGCCCMIM